MFYYLMEKHKKELAEKGYTIFRNVHVCLMRRKD